MTESKSEELISIPEKANVTITQQSVMWIMPWGDNHPDKPAEEIIFEDEGALALLLLNEVIFLNSYHWKKEWPEEAKRTTALCVNCSDVFMWGCADAEPANYEDIEDIYRHWAKDTEWGAAVWCIKKRKYMPQYPVYKDILKAGIWNLDETILEPNPSFP